jgi:hypothetical protein
MGYDIVLLRIKSDLDKAALVAEMLERRNSKFEEKLAVLCGQLYLISQFHIMDS